MSLIDSFMTECVLMDKHRIPDGEDGFLVEWIESVKFKAAITVDNSTLSMIAEKQGVTGNYTITTSRNVLLGFEDIIKRVSDGSYFRVITKKGDIVSPNVSSLDIAQVKAEPLEYLPK